MTNAARPPNPSEHGPSIGAADVGRDGTRDPSSGSQLTSAWQEFYDLKFAKSVLHGRDDADLEHATQFLWESLCLTPRARVFDQGAGVGDIAQRLARRGCIVTAIERVPDYVEELHRRADGCKGVGRVDVVAADASCAEIGTDFDAGYSWHTSFGHAASDAENLALLVRAQQALRLGGRFVLDYYGTPALLRQFVARTTTRVGAGETAMVVTRESELDLRRGLLHQVWRREHRNGEIDERRGATRMYMPHELCELHQRTGLKVLSLAGSWRGEPFTVDSPRCIVISERSAVP